MFKDLIEVGHLGKAVGFEGELRIEFNSTFESEGQIADWIFLEVAHEILPYHVEYMEIGEQPVVKFKTIDDREEAKGFSGSPIYLRENDMSIEWSEIADDELTFSKYKGFTMYSHLGQKISEILRVEAFPQQEMAVVEIGGKEKYIPLHDDLIKEIVGESIYVIIPDGLLEL